MRKFIIAAAVCAVIMGCEKNTGKEEDSVDIPLTITVSDNGFSMEDRRDLFKQQGILGRRPYRSVRLDERRDIGRLQ